MRQHFSVTSYPSKMRYTGLWDHPANHRAMAGFLTALALLSVLACSSDSATGTASTSIASSTDKQEPSRVAIREGLFLRDSAHGDANFSAVLPENWSVADEPQYPIKGLEVTPTGSFGKVGEVNMSMRYSVQNAGPVDPRMRPDQVRHDIEIDGVPVVLLVPSEPNDFRRIAAYFPWLPGDAARAFGLSIEASGISNETTFTEVRSIVESIQFAPPPPSPSERPGSEIEPGRDWTRVLATWSDSQQDGPFSVLAPPGWEFIPGAGLDSLVGTFTNGTVSIDFDYGSASSNPIQYQYHLTDPDYFPEHEYWIEVIDGKPFTMYRPVDSGFPERAFTGIRVDRIPGLPDLKIEGPTYSSTIYDCGGSFLSDTGDHAERELVLAILRTIRAETLPATCQ